MIVINTVSNERFSLNGIEYFKNFLSFVYGDNVGIYNAYDKTDQRVNLDLYSNFTVNGVLYESAALLQSALLGVIYTRDTLGAVNTVLKGSVKPTDTPTGTGVAFWVATQAGTYTNFGGVIVSANSFAVISRDATGAFSISQTTFDITSKVNVSDVINTLVSTETTKPLSAAQGKALNEKIAQGIVNWTAKAFLINDEVSHLGKLWQANAAIISTDVPGTSSKWVEILSGKADLAVGKNLFNKATAVIGYFLGNDNVASINATYDYSDFIPVVSGQQYTSGNSMRFTTYFSETKTLIAGGASANTSTFTIPSGVFYVKITIFHTNLNTFQLEKGSLSTTFEDYKNTVPSSQIDFSLYSKKTELAIVANSISAKADLILGKNLFDKSKVTNGYYVDPYTGTLMTTSGISASDFCSILPSTQYFFNTTRNYTAFYDANKVFLSGSSSAFPLTSPANAYYVRVSVNTASIATAQLEAGSSATTYNSYYFKIPFNQLPVITSNWNTYETNCLGDSITSGNMWQPSLALNLGLSITNFGIGGTKISGTDTNSFNNDSRVNALSNTAKLVIVLGGTNDWAQNISLGAEDSTSLSTFYGGLNVLITKLLTKYNTAGVFTKFLFLGTTYGELYDFVPRGWANAYTNNLQLTTKDYAEAIKKRCLFYGIPYCDTSNLGWNNINIRQYITDDGGLLHPNTNGGRRIAEVVTGKLKQIEPIV